MEIKFTHITANNAPSSDWQHRKRLILEQMHKQARERQAGRRKKNNPDAASPPSSESSSFECESPGIKGIKKMALVGNLITRITPKNKNVKQHNAVKIVITSGLQSPAQLDSK